MHPAPHRSPRTLIALAITLAIIALGAIGSLELGTAQTTTARARAKEVKTRAAPIASRQNPQHEIVVDTSTRTDTDDAFDQRVATFTTWSIVNGAEWGDMDPELQDCAVSVFANRLSATPEDAITACLSTLELVEGDE